MLWLKSVAMQRLGAGEWFTARVSSCGLFQHVYPASPDPTRAELRALYGQLSHDDMPMVRRSAALHMGKFAATVEPQLVNQEILTFFKDLTNDGENKCFWFTSASEKILAVISFDSMLFSSSHFLVAADSLALFGCFSVYTSRCSYFVAIYLF